MLRILAEVARCRSKKCGPGQAATDGGPLGRVICDGGPDQTPWQTSLVLLRGRDSQNYPQAVINRSRRAIAMRITTRGRARMDGGRWEKVSLAQAGIGIAIETLIENTVRVTITKSDNAPIASVAATASVSRDDAAGAERALKPAPPGDHFMAGDPLESGRESPAWIERLRKWLAILRQNRLKIGKIEARSAFKPTTRA